MPDHPYEIRTVCFKDDDGTIAPLPLELRALSTPNDDTPQGYDAYFLTWMTLDDRGTVFEKGAARKTLGERLKKAPVLWNHDWFGAPPIGSHIEGQEDDRGALVRTRISDTSTGNDVLQLMKDKVPLGHSFGFERMKDRSATDADTIDRSAAPDWLATIPAKDIRVIQEFKIIETSPVTFASNPKANTVAVRSLLSPDEIEDVLAKIRAGSLDPAEVRDLGRIIAAWEETRAAAISTDAPILDHARTFAPYDLDLMFLGLEDMLLEARQ